MKKRLIHVIVKFLEWNMKSHGNMYLKAICGGGGGGGGGTRVYSIHCLGRILI